jgi:hypothetical protein
MRRNQAKSMEQDKQLTESESLKLITNMINKAKDDYSSTGISALLWGSLISFCSIVTFANYYLKWNWAGYVWYLTIFGALVQFIISGVEKRKRKYRTYHEDALGGIWTSYAIAIFLLSYFADVYEVPHVNSLFIIIYGMPTFASGLALKFKPMLFGGLLCWLFAILSMHTPFPYTMLYSAAAAQFAWFIPGIILRRRYLKAKSKHV